MRDFRATKDEHEREESEAERLVRPQPKLKPPRRDRRRERMETERDPDTSGDKDLKGDPDLSMNYKTIGGSQDFRRFVRIALGESDKVKVVNKDTDKVVMVSPETLKENGSKYEAVEEGEGEKDDGKPAPSLRELAAQNPQVKGMMDILSNPKHPQYMVLTTPAIQQRKLNELGGLADVKFPPGVVTVADFQKALSQPEPAAAPAKPTKKTPAKPKAPDAPKAEEAPKAEGDKPAEAPKAEGEKPAEAPAEPASPLDTMPDENRKFLDGIVKKFQKDQGEAKKPKTVDDALAGVDPNTLPEPYKSAVLAELEKSKAKDEGAKAEGEKAKPSKGEKSKGEDETPKKPEPWPGRRKVTRGEVKQAQALVAKELPARLAAKFINLHPDDAQQLVAKYKGYKQLGAFESDEEFQSSLGKLKKSFTLDADSIPAPTHWKTKKGKVPFGDLSPEEQDEALREHRSATLAYNIAMRDRAIETLAARGLSRSAAAASVDLSLKKDPEPKSAADFESYHEERRSRVAGLAKEHFIASTASGSPPMTPKARSAAIEAAKTLDPEAQQIALAKVQANDFNEITSKYLGGKTNRFLSDRALFQRMLISEADSPSKIVAKMNAAMEELRERAKDYPDHVRANNPDPARVFRRQLLSRLERVSRDKANEVQKHFAKHDRVEYDKKKAEYDREVASYKKKHSAYEKRFENWLKRKAKAESSDGKTPYRSAPPAKFDIPPPVPPVKPKEPTIPPGYYEVAHQDQVPSKRKSRNEMREVEERLGLAERVVNKLKSLRKRKSASLYSSYGYRDLTMGTPMPTEFGTREAVYHGVEPAKAKAYPAWEQAHVCEMGSSDSNAILAAAREWLKAPVLAKAIDGMPEDARFRAALDLAIREAGDGKYSAAVDAVAYNELLSKLSGDHSDPLGTIGRKEASFASEARSLAASVAAVNPGLAYDLLDFADRPAPEAKVVVQKQASEDDTYVALRSTVIRVASEHPALRDHLRPVLRLIKTIDEVRDLRAASGD